MNKDQPQKADSRVQITGRLPTAIWTLGLVSLLMDTSSELIHSLSPVLLVSVLGASIVTVGFIEGVAEATATVTKVFSGALSDYFQKRKALIVLGYALGALSKPLFPLASAASWIFAARFTDRIGKGIRDAPRDALIADLTGQTERGGAYGLRQALDSLGAVAGPLLAVLLMLQFSGQIRAALWVAVVPAVLAVLVLMLLVREPERKRATAHERFNWAEAKRLPQAYWIIVGVGAVFTAARFSDSFVVLRARDVGLSATYAPMVIVVMNCFFAAAAYPAGAAADRIGPRTLLTIGLLFLIAADLIIGLGHTWLPIFGGAALWGLHLAFTQGVFAKVIADSVPTELRGTGFGIFDLARGFGFFVANTVAGGWWKTAGPPAAFFSAAAFATIAAIGLSAATRHRK